MKDAMKTGFFARLQLKPRLQITFLTITTLAILAVALFSLAFFYKTIEENAVNSLRDKAAVMQTMLETKKAAVLDYASNIAADKTLQLLLDMDISAKLSDLVMGAVKDSKYHIAVFKTSGEAYCDVGFSQSQLALEGRRISPAEEKMVRQALGSERTALLAQLVTGAGTVVPAVSAAVPVIRDRRIIGALVVLYVLGDNPEFFDNLHSMLGVEVALHIQGRNKAGNPRLAISGDDYLEMVSGGSQFEHNDLIGTGLDNYLVLKDGFGAVLGVLQLHQTGDPFRNSFLTALFFYLIFSLFMIGGLSFLIMRTSQRILEPIGTLLNGVKRIADGDLRYEIHLMVKDEIGTLGQAFDEMRQSLSSKIDEIKELNSGLEAKVRERTQQIESLNTKLRHYLSPQLYESLVGGQRDTSVDKHYRKKLTIFFSDLVNFTATTDSMEPEDLSNLLNRYLDEMAKIAQHYGGTIDKYVGDAIMVFFGDPEFTSDKDHAERAVGMSLDMLAKLDELRDEWREKGIVNPFHVRIGINTGYCTVGNFGSEAKMDYTIIGNNVNLAARYEAAAEADTVLMSHETFMLVHDTFDVQEMGEFTLKGIPNPVKAYRPLRRKASRLDGWISVGDMALSFRTRKIDLSQVNDEERALLKSQLRSALEKLE
jgi:class 3 adenylate cyclase